MSIRNQKKLIILLAVFTIIVIAFNKSYALFQATAVSDKPVVQITTPDKLPLSLVVKNKIVKYEESSKDTFQGGLIAINTDSFLYNEKDSSQNIREYRYSGLNVDNYVYFNCKDETTYETASSNCELWRIIGVFKNNNSGEEKVKIVRNEVLNGILPEFYKAYSRQYQIKGNSDNTAYWNTLQIEYDYNYNDWSYAGLRYWLNSLGASTGGYLKMFNAVDKNMIEKEVWHLGGYPYDGNSLDVIYKDERSSYYLYGGNSSSSYDEIGLMYPSDYGYSANSNYWDSNINDYDEAAKTTSWLQMANHENSEWFISPSTDDDVDAAYWTSNGGIGGGVSVRSNYFGVRPALYLKASVKKSDGDGSQSNPYFLSA